MPHSPHPNMHGHFIFLHPLPSSASAPSLCAQGFRKPSRRLRWKSGHLVDLCLRLWIRSRDVLKLLPVNTVKVGENGPKRPKMKQFSDNYQKL